MLGGTMTWRVARALDTLLAQLNALAPNRSKLSDGSIGDAAHATRDSDHNPWYPPPNGGIVTARDFTHDPGGGLDCHWLAARLVDSREFRVKYVIWNRRILSGAPGPSPWIWRAYSGPNPHTKHLHLSVVASPACDDTRPWNLGTSEEDDMDAGQARMLAEIHEQLTRAWPSFLDGRVGFTLVDYARNLDVHANTIKIALAGLSDDEARIITELRASNATQTSQLISELAKLSAGGSDPAVVAAALAGILGPELVAQVADELGRRLAAQSGQEGEPLP